jgi:hypothetical protein
LDILGKAGMSIVMLEMRRCEPLVVYLDQNAASFLAKPNPEPIWREIKEGLADGFRNRKLICPLPFECLLESAPKPLEFRQSIQSLFWQLSEGVAFKDFSEMSNELTLGLVRPAADWSPWIILKPIWAEMESAAQNVRANWKSAKVRMTERMNSFVRSPEVERMSRRELFHAIAAQRSAWICRDLGFLLSERTAEDSLKFPDLIEFLTSVNLSPAEIAALRRAVQHHGWAKIPIHAFDILLSARREYDSIRGGSAPYEPNDEIDRVRAAMALTYADVFITEGDLANLCQTAKVKEFCPTRVLSVRCPKEILEVVHAITDNQKAGENRVR